MLTKRKCTFVISFAMIFFLLCTGSLIEIKEYYSLFLQLLVLLLCYIVTVFILVSDLIFCRPSCFNLALSELSSYLYDRSPEKWNGTIFFFTSASQISVLKVLANIFVHLHFPGEDISVCVCLAILTSLFNDGGALPYLATSSIYFLHLQPILPFGIKSNYFRLFYHLFFFPEKQLFH
jgi:hypothetical protein